MLLVIEVYNLKKLIISRANLVFLCPSGLGVRKINKARRNRIKYETFEYNQRAVYAISEYINHATTTSILFRKSSFFCIPRTSYHCICYEPIYSTSIH